MQFWNLLLAATVIAKPSFGEYDRGDKDTRSPCPMFNTLANHGYLPRDGSTMTASQIIAAFSTYGAFDPQLTGFLLSSAFNKGVGNKATQTLDLISLRTHGLSEHDASLFRTDYYFGGDWFNRKDDLVEKLLEKADKDDVDYITVDHLVSFRRERYLESVNKNPTFVYTPAVEQVIFGELALFALFLSPNNPYQIPVKIVKAFAEDERLPIKEGWVKSSSPITPTKMLTFAFYLKAKYDALGPI